MSDTDGTITVTIDGAHAQSIEPIVVEPLSHLLYWKKICTSFDIQNYSLSGTINLNYEDGHEPKLIETFSNTIKLETLMNLVSAQNELYMQQKGMIFNVEINELKAFILFYLFYLYIYPPEWQESSGGANTKGRQLPQPASGDTKILLSACNLIEV